MHKCTCDWCPAYREDLDAQTKGYDRALAELAEARVENERLRAALGEIVEHCELVGEGDLNRRELLDVIRHAGAALAGTCATSHPAKAHVTCILPAGHEGRHQRYADGGGDTWATLPTGHVPSYPGPSDACGYCGKLCIKGDVCPARPTGGPRDE